MKKYYLQYLLPVLVFFFVPFKMTADESYIRGDSNGDGVVNIKDVTCLIDYVMSGSWPDEGTVENKKIKVLFFGNSYTANSVFYLPFILGNNGVDFKVSFFFAAGEGVDYFYNSWDSVAPTLYTFDSETDSVWHSEHIKPKVAVESDDWDLLVLQQFSQVSFVQDSYSNVGNLVNLIKASTEGKDSKIGWNITHPNGQIAYNYPLQSFACMESACQQNGIDVVLPYGTAICNALTKYVCRAYANPSINANRNFKLSDNTHLSPGLPMYIASLAIAQALSDEFSLGFSVQDDTTTPTVAWSTQGSVNYKGISPVYTNINFLAVTDEFRDIAKRAVAAAMENKFTVTQLDGETMKVTYNLTGCHIEGSAPTTGINFGETLSFRIVADEGKTMSSVTSRKIWGSDIPYELGENGEFEKVVTEDLVITATAL